MTNEEYFAGVLDYLTFNKNHSVLEWGTAAGSTLSAILNVLISRNQIPSQVIAFDSFLGLPMEEEGVPKSKDWFPGAFNLLYENQNNNEVQQKANTFSEALIILRDRFRQYEKHNIFVQLVEGFYNDTLNKNTLEQFNIKPAMLIHIDCDLYISAKQALEFCAQNNLFGENCLVEYNDWGGTRENLGGESKAHYEIVDKYGLKFETIRKGQQSLFRYRGKNA